MTETIEIDEFLRTGKFGNKNEISFGITRNDLFNLIGQTDWYLYTTKKSKFPSLYRYGKVEFYFEEDENGGLIGIQICPLYQEADLNGLNINYGVIESEITYEDCILFFQDISIKYEIVQSKYDTDDVRRLNTEGEVHVIFSIKSDWRFNWKQLLNSKDKFYKVNYENQTQGIIKLEEENDAYFVLKNIEVAPWNFGSKGKFKNVAEILTSFACLQSFELNHGNYKGFLVFTSKGSLIEYYQQKYNAELIFRERMIINPIIGKQLIKMNLEIDIEK